MPNQLFAKKSLTELLAEAAGENRLRRVLGPVSLTALGVGAVIGAGIFVATGAAAKDVAGPSLMVSYMVAGVTCIFAALCYAEFASMAPVAGSAYTYAYTTMGELFAWIIGWDLVLEYAVGAATVANGWSGYFQSVLKKVGIIIPVLLSGAPHKYDEGLILPNSVAKYPQVLVVQQMRDVPKEELKEGQPAKALYWVRLSNNKLVATVDKPGLEKNFAGPQLTYRFLTLRLYEEPVEVTQKVRKLPKEEQKEGQPQDAIYWVYKDNNNIRLGKVGDQTVEAKLTDHERAMINLPAIIITIIITLVLVKGIQEGASFNALMVFIKVAAVVFVILVGSYYVNPQNWEPFAPHGWTGVSFFGIPVAGKSNAAGEPIGMLAGAAIIFFAYIGFDSVSTHAEEAIKPQRDVPIGIIASLLICTVLYIAVVAVLTGMVSYDKLSKDAGVSDAFKQAGLPWAEIIIATAGVAGITSVLLVMMLSAPRVFLAMARDGLVPHKFFADVHPRYKTPWKSTIAIGIFVCLLTGFLPIDALLHLTNIGTLFAFVVVCGAVLIMRRTNPNAERPFRCPFVPVVPILGIGCCLLLMLSLPAANWWRLFAWLGIGLVIYFLYGRRHSYLGKQLRGGTVDRPTIPPEAMGSGH